MLDLRNKVFNTAQKMGTSTAEAFARLMEKMADSVDTATDAVANAVDETAQKVKDSSERMADSMRDQFDGLRFDIGVGFDVDDMPGGGSIPKLASGGIVTRPTIALVGENEPEAVVPLSRLGRGGGEIHNHIHLGDREIALQMLKLTPRLLRELGLG